MGRYLALLAEWPEVSVGSPLWTEISRLVSGEGDSAETEQEMKADGAAPALPRSAMPSQTMPL